jgi:hypothetical protein
VLAATYFLITKTLWKGMRHEREFKKQLSKQSSSKCFLFFYFSDVIYLVGLEDRLRGKQTVDI